MVKVDLQKLWEGQPDQTRQFAQSVLSEEFDEFETFLQDLLQMELELWVDAEGYSRRARIEMSMADMMFVEIDQRMFDFDEDIIIRLPENAAQAARAPTTTSIP